MKISRSVAEFTWSRVARLLLNVYYYKLLNTQSTYKEHCHEQDF
jgi:hypothetical protein